MIHFVSGLYFIITTYFVIFTSLFIEPIIMTNIALQNILEDEVELIKLARKGIDYKLFNDIVNKEVFGLEEWSTYLHLTVRTLQRYKKENKTFEPLQSERILEIARLQKRGEEVFGDKENFNTWMDSDIIALGGNKPKDFLDNSFGITLLNQELTRIEHGILA